MRIQCSSALPLESRTQSHSDIAARSPGSPTIAASTLIEGNRHRLDLSAAHERDSCPAQYSKQITFQTNHEDR
jgi:hypothetical protein